MESQQSIGVEGVLVPNVYDVSLSSYDYAHFEPARQSLVRNLESHLGRVARQHRFQMVSSPVVRLHSDDAMSAGQVRVVSHLQDMPAPKEAEVQHTSILPKADVPIERRPATPNFVMDGKSHAVLRTPTKIGRLADNDIVVNDKRVSRHHAELVQRGGRWVLRDTGSTNGTAVNGKLVKEAVLKPGDTLSLGGLEATWEQ